MLLQPESCCCFYFACRRCKTPPTAAILTTTHRCPAVVVRLLAVVSVENCRSAPPSTLLQYLGGFLSLLLSRSLPLWGQHCSTWKALPCLCHCSLPQSFVSLCSRQLFRSSRDFATSTALAVNRELVVHLSQSARPLSSSSSPTTTTTATTTVVDALLLHRHPLCVLFCSVCVFCSNLAAAANINQLLFVVSNLQFSLFSLVSLVSTDNNPLPHQTLQTHRHRP